MKWHILYVIKSDGERIGSMIHPATDFDEQKAVPPPKPIRE